MMDDMELQKFKEKGEYQTVKGHFDLTLKL